MAKKILSLTLCLFFCMVTAALSTDQIKIQFSYAFCGAFPDDLQNIGVPKGDVFQLGALVIPGDFPITEVTAKNLQTGLILKPTSSKGSIAGLPNLYEVEPQPPFDPIKHLGVWEIRIKDEKGNEAVTKTHKFEKEAKMPFVTDIKASGNPLAPTITWLAPDEMDIPEGCRLSYEIRLIKNFESQFYRAPNLTETKHQIPEGKLKSGDLSDTYIRIICACWDKDDKDHPLPLELWSNTFRPLKEALGK